MTSPQPSKPKKDDQGLMQLLKDRIAQLENRVEDPPRSPDEQDAEDAFQVASAAARALVADKDIMSEEKLRFLQLMFEDCVSNVRTLEYDLGLEEKRLSVAELEYSDLGEDLRKIESSMEKLKSLSRQLSKQNKIMMEETKKRTADEKRKREEIVEKFDEAMKDINARLNTGEFIEEEKDDVALQLESDLEHLQEKYEKRELFYEKSLNEAIEEERKESKLYCQSQEEFEKDELLLVTERRKLMDLKKKSRILIENIKKISDQKKEIETKSNERREVFPRQKADLKRLQQSEIDVRKVSEKLYQETENVKARSKETINQVKSNEDELEFWKTKSKTERDKRQALERLCRTMTEERTIMRKEVQAIQAAWEMLEKEIENLRMEIDEAEDT